MPTNKTFFLYFKKKRNDKIECHAYNWKCPITQSPNSWLHFFCLSSTPLVAFYFSLYKTWKLDHFPHGYTGKSLISMWFNTPLRMVSYTTYLFNTNRYINVDYSTNTIHDPLLAQIYYPHGVNSHSQWYYSGL